VINHEPLDLISAGSGGAFEAFTLISGALFHDPFFNQYSSSVKPSHRPYDASASKLYNLMRKCFFGLFSDFLLRIETLDRLLIMLLSRREEKL
jgi:hypothetical protein